MRTAYLGSDVFDVPEDGIAGVDQLSLGRLYALRATYLLLVVGLGSTVWPGILHHERQWELMQGVETCLLGGVAVMAVFGLRYPVRMLPLLLFEFVWKSIWLLIVAAPLWLGRRMDAETSAIASACLMGVIFPIVIPWPYVVRNYLLRRGDRWR